MNTPAEFPSPTPDRLKVAIISESPLDHMCGVTNSVLRTLDYLQEAQHEAMVICPPSTPSEYAGSPIVTSRYARLQGFNTGLTLPGGRGIQDRLDRADFKPDVIHAASPFGLLGMAAVRAADNLGIPSVAIYQTNIPQYLKRSHMGIAVPWAQRRIAKLHNAADLTLAPSSAAVQDLVTWGTDSTRIKLWTRGVDAALYNPERRNSKEVADLRQKIAPNGEPIVGYVGRLAPEKQIGRLAALRGLDAKFVIVGDGPERAGLESSLGDQAVFLGELRGEPLADAYAALDIFTHTGSNETFGQTLQEAMASQKPVIAPRAGGPLDIVAHDKSGFLYNPDDDLEFRGYVEALIKDSDQRQSMGEIGRQRIIPRSWDMLCKQLVGHYYSVM